MRIGSVGIAGSATPSRRPVSGGKRPKDKPIYNNWEKGIAKDDRGMPYLDKQGVEVGVKQFSETRRDYRQFQSPTV